MCDKEEEDWSKNKPANLEIVGETIPLVKVRDKLRFKVGDVVECMIRENTWATGVIVDTNYREPYWPASQPSAPYQIALAENVPKLRSRPSELHREVPPGYERSMRFIFSTWDDDLQIRKLPEGAKIPPRVVKLQMDIAD